MFRLSGLLLILASNAPVAAQEEQTYTVPDPIFEMENAALAELRGWSLDKWFTVRTTNHPLYTYAMETVRFRAYQHICRRHDLNVDMTTLNEVAVGNLSEVIAAHYEEAEWLKFGNMSERDIRTFIADVGHDIYAFEYASALADIRATKEETGDTTKAFCTGIAKEYQDSYIALRATARRKLAR